MSDVVDSKPAPTKDNLEWISDLARYRENLLDEQTIRKRYQLADAVWEKLALDDELIRAVEAESTRRIRTGQQKKERAQQFAVKVPEMAAGIAFDAGQNARHRLDAGALLDKLSANEPGQQGAPASDRFQITIVLNSDVERYDKSIAVDVNDIDPNHSDDAPQVPFPVIAARKPTDDGNGEPV